MANPLTRADIFTRWVLSFFAYQDEVTLIEEDSVAYGIAKATAEAGEMPHALFDALLRRHTLLQAKGDDLDPVLEEHGAPRRGERYARVVACFQPWSENVTAITSGGTDLIEVTDSSKFPVSASLRIVQGATDETATVIAVTSGTGPNGGDEIEVATLSGSYTPASGEVFILRRHTLPARTQVRTSAGVVFELLESVAVGDSNPLFGGEVAPLSLADKGWAECTARGATGQIDANTLATFVTSTPEVRSVYNPEAAVGGEAEDSDTEARRRAAYLPALQSVDTNAWLFSQSQAGSLDVIRAWRTDTSVLRQIKVMVLHRSVGPLTTTAKGVLAAFLEARCKDQIDIEIDDIPILSISISATITLEADATLRQVWIEAVRKFAAFIDPRTWDREATVERADLITILNRVAGVATLNSETMTPLTDTTPTTEQLPLFTSLSLTDSASGDTLSYLLDPGF